MAETRPHAAAISRILTLVFTDLADSTALKTQQGDQRVGELIARHRAQVSTLAAASAGRVIDWAGDGCFLTFDTPSAAVTFALRLQQAHGEEPDLPGVRTGIHMGELGERPGSGSDAAAPRIEGLAVDLAARICGLARPAQVLMSSAVADSARQRLDAHAFSLPIAWRSYGGYSLKGFDNPLEIAEAGLEGVAPLAAPVASEKATPARPAPSVPQRSKLLRAGVVAAILGIAIAGASWWMKVRRSDAAEKPARKSVAVLPFVNMSSDKENEYFSDGITEDLITALAAGEREGLERKPTEDLEAYQLYLKARYDTASLTSDGVKRAIGYLQEAVARDPNYAPAHLNMAYYYMNITDGFMPANESLPRVRDAARTALRLDPSLAEAHTWLAVVHWWYDRDYKAARREFQTALAMQPNFPSARE
jgi:class 3 adenylate cyclase